MLIYKITNKLNGKSYIGQTIQGAEKRWKEHCKKSKSSVSAIASAIQLYGKDNFTFDILLSGISNIEELNKLEKFYIEELKTISPSGYNLTTGGLNYIVSDSTKEKMSKGLIGKKLSEETKLKIKESKIDLKFSINSIYKQKLGKLINNLHANTGSGVRYNKKDNAYQAFIYVDGKIKTKTFTVSLLGEIAKDLAPKHRELLEKETILYYNLKIENHG